MERSTWGGKGFGIGGATSREGGFRDLVSRDRTPASRDPWSSRAEDVVGRVVKDPSSRHGNRGTTNVGSEIATPPENWQTVTHCAANNEPHRLAAKGIEIGRDRLAPHGEEDGSIHP